MFNETAIRQALSDTPFSCFFFSTVDSTNSEAKRCALDGRVKEALFLAEGQTAGRGRMGRSFFSPHGTGLYLSLLLKTGDSLSDPVTATTASAVAVRQAIDSVTGISVGIKWVNDLYLDGKKICGILAESFFAEDTRYLIVGVGVNLSTVDFPKELQETAGSLFSNDTPLRDALAAEIAKRLYTTLTNTPTEALMQEYRVASIVLGREITYTQNQIAHCGIAESIDDLGRLCVRHSDGSTALLASGEISLRIHDKQGEPI